MPTTVVRARQRMRCRLLTQSATLRTSTRSVSESGGSTTATTDTAVIGALSARDARSAATTNGATQTDERGAYVWEYPLDANGNGLDALGRTVGYPFGATLIVGGQAYRIVWTPLPSPRALTGVVGLSEA